MATADKLNKLLATKTAIKTSLINKGVEVSDDTIFADYPSKIDSIQSGVDSSYKDFYYLFTENGTNFNQLFMGSTVTEINLNDLDTSTVINMKETFSGCTALTSLNIGNWNTGSVTDMSNMFYNCNQLTSLDISNFNTSNVTTMNSMFQECNSLTSIMFGSSWNTSNVTTMNSMFRDCQKLTSLDLNSWNTSNVTTMSSMFNGCSALASLDLSNFNTSKVTDMTSMFQNCSALTTLDISNWSTSSISGARYLFTGCASLKTIIGELDASNVSTGFFFTSSHDSFKGCTSLETLYIKNIYKECTMTNASKWCINLGDTKVKDECLIYIINELPDLINDKGLTDTDKIILTLPLTNTLTAEQVQVAINKGWQVANTTY